MKARIVTFTNSRSRGLAPIMMGNLSDEDSYLHAGSDESVEGEDGELYRLEIRNGKKVFTKSRHEPSLYGELLQRNRLFQESCQGVPKH